MILHKKNHFKKLSGASGNKAGSTGLFIRGMLFYYVTSLFLLLNCVDSYNKTPVPTTIAQQTRPPNAVIPPDAITSSTPDLRFDSGFVSSSQCTLFLFMRFCNGIIRIRLGEQPGIFNTFRDSLSKPPYCQDSNKTYNNLNYVFSGLKPNTTYYMNIYGTWYPEYPPWNMNGTFSTRPDSSLNSLSTTIP